MRLLLFNNNTLTQAYQRAVSDTIDVANLLIWNSNLNALYVGGSSWTVSGQRDALIGKYNRIPTGIRELSALNVSVFPNPVADYLIVSGRLDKDTRLNVWDQSGKLIYQENINSGIQNKKLDCTSWLPGVYVLQLANSKSKKIIQIIKK
jgi:hypothetical protein